ncbi:hypothetical protein O3M35_005978 [Rhynocoris fuscipes]|uniref:NADH dehydrogenase [ubiquinone] 1 alpha subcomplex subunit 10, mitochondrial n=1 Tax=Rhynocoris fuscipes TaxID=488301 RepID=A0AAW1DDA4_9HEMI
MALFVIGSNLKKCSGKVFLSVNSVAPILSATIVSKALRDVKPKPAPYPYKEKHYRVWNSWFDRTTSRFDENSKLIVVDGPISAGKCEFAKKLAEELDMLHIPDANMDTFYINSYGYDMRKLDPQLPESMQSFDEKDFCQNPYHCNAAGFQFWMYRLRYSLYVDALAHILSTGQGVVIQRSPWSSAVFTEAMYKNKYLSKEARYVFSELTRNTLQVLMRPHLVIYLDMPVSAVKSNIMKNGQPFEKSSKALTDQYLQDIEDYYKTHYLPEITTHAELLMYDWSQGGDVEAVVEDIEEIDFDKYTKHDTKMKDWCKSKERVWAEYRHLYADRKQYLMSLFNVPIFSAPELVVSGEDWATYTKVVLKAPGMRYTRGYNPDFGDDVLLKTKSVKYIPY